MKPEEIVKRFNDKRVIVLGDVMLDEFIYGDVSRINPEAPVPVLQVKKTEHLLGGAANAALNIASLGGKPFLIGRIGEDENGEKIKQLLESRNIESHLVKSSCPTIKKTRIIARSQQVIRVDWEEPTFINDDVVDGIIEIIKKKKAELILISDYAKGMVSKRLMSKLKALDKKIIVDPKPQNMHLYKNVYAVKPNSLEAKEMSNKQKIEEAGRDIQKKLCCNVILTLGDKGAHVFTDKTDMYIPTTARTVYDVAGAGDTFAATLALGLAAGGDLKDSVHLANITSGLVIEKLGIASVSNSELLDEIEEDNNKIKSSESMKEIITDLHKKGKKVVFTNGCFDIIHSGHVQLLKQSRAFGDVLIVGINGDKSPWFKRKPGRPINDQNERAEVLSGLEFVDYIVIFDEERAVPLIEKLKPDIYVKGGDYNPDDYDNLPEAKTVTEYGGKVEIISLVEGKSTTNIIEKMKSI